MFTLKSKNYYGLLLAILTVLSGCGSSSTTTPSFNGVEYVVVNAGDMAQTSTVLSGTGSLVFKSPLSSVNSKNSYRLAFTLQDGGSLSLVSNCTAALAEGATIKFSRSGTTLSVSLIASAGTTDVSSKFVGVDASQNLTYQADVHNDEAPSHILIWNGTETSFSESAAVLNSEDSGLNAPAKGTGTYWGLELSKASLTGASLSAAKFSE